MANLLFCNIGWMSRYQGLRGKPDKIVGGGKFVDENKRGAEVCNFLRADDGHVYGHVETWHGRKTGAIDREIHLEKFGGSRGDSDKFDVIWTATDPENRGRKIVGWYENAEVFRHRQYFDGFPSKQHRKDEVESYRVCVKAKNAHLLDFNRRDSFALGSGTGWMGHTPWWAPSKTSSREIRNFAERVRKLLASSPVRPNGNVSSNGTNGGSKSPGSPKDPYVRYVTEYEVTVSPRHTELQRKFETFLKGIGVTELKPNIANVDLRYRDLLKRNVLSEIKPCNLENARYAIRTAMGQLLDYEQLCDERSQLLIVLERAPKKNDISLALQNGFGLAYPLKNTFKTVWPTETLRT